MIKTSDTVFSKNIPLTLFERFVCERKLETEQNCNILTPTLVAISFVSFSFSRVAQPEAREPTLLGAGFLHHILSPNSPISKLTDFLSSPSYIIVQLLLVGVTIALIQPIHCQDYNSDIPRPDAPVIYIGAFPILTARLGRRSLYNTFRSEVVLPDKVLSMGQREVFCIYPVCKQMTYIKLK